MYGRTHALDVQIQKLELFSAPCTSTPCYLVLCLANSIQHTVRLRFLCTEEVTVKSVGKVALREAFNNSIEGCGVQCQ